MIKRTVSQQVFDTKSALNAARKGHEEACREFANTPVHLLDVGNTNHPINYGLFGYITEEFMSMQHK